MIEDEEDVPLGGERPPEEPRAVVVEKFVRDAVSRIGDRRRRW